MASARIQKSRGLPAINRRPTIVCSSGTQVPIIPQVSAYALPSPARALLHQCAVKEVTIGQAGPGGSP